MILSTASIILAAFAAHPGCPSAPQALMEQVTVYVGMVDSMSQDYLAVVGLRQTLNCHSAFTVVNDPYDADISVSLIFAVRELRNPVLTHQIAVSIVGRELLPGNLWIGDESWQGCGRALAGRLLTLLTPAPHLSVDGTDVV